VWRRFYRFSNPEDNFAGATSEANPLESQVVFAQLFAFLLQFIQLEITSSAGEECVELLALELLCGRVRKLIDVVEEGFL
jgi:hypothetical protein